VVQILKAISNFLQRDAILKSRWSKWGVGLVCWTILGLVFSSQSYVFYAVHGGDVRWGPTFAWVFADWYSWALLSLLIFWLARKIRIERGNWTRSVPTHLVLSILFCVVHSALQAAVNQLPLGFGHPPRPFAELFKYLLLENYSIGILTYWVLIGISHFAEYYRRYREREALLVQAQLQALKMQLQPHFLFNSLNSISSLIDHDPKAGITMVARLGDFLRLTLNNSGEDEIALEQELEFLKRYLEIEMIRFEHRLTVEIDVPSDVYRARVPNLILQPIVENAIRHGLADSEGPAHIEIRARRVSATLRLEVRDNGRPANNGNEPLSSGVGLANTRARLVNLYGGMQRLDFCRLPLCGFRVSMEIPYRSAAEPNSGE
jgi:two-component system LytT family sensor kinase